MKKSYDYFKTLKDLSECVGESYSSAVCGEDFKKYSIRFWGLKSELSECLMNDFVTPVERSDIYKLSFCLNEELWQVSELFNYISLTNADSFAFVGQIGDLFNHQNKAMAFIEDMKQSEKTLKFVTESLLKCDNLKKQILKSVRNSLEKANQPLISYSVNRSFLNLVKTIEITFSEVERVIINMS